MAISLLGLTVLAAKLSDTNYGAYTHGMLMVVWVVMRLTLGRICLLPRAITRSRFARVYVRHTAIILYIWSLLKSACLLILPGKVSSHPCSAPHCSVTIQPAQINRYIS
jgi:hypothetical protein